MQWNRNVNLVLSAITFTSNFYLFTYAALQVLHPNIGISLQLRLGNRGRSGVVTGLKWGSLMWKLSQLFLCTKTEATNPGIFSAVRMWKQTEHEKLQYLQAVSLALLETSQGSLETPSSVGFNRFLLIAFTIVWENPFWATGSGQRLWLQGKGNWEMPEVPATSALNRRIP